MDSNQLYHFRAIAEEESITRAANRLYVSQPALSISLGKLEAELDCLLFIRDGKKLHLTNEGRKLLNYATIVTDTIDEANDYFSSRDKKRVTLFHTGGINYPLLSRDCICKEGFYYGSVLVENDDLRKTIESGVPDIVLSDDRHLPEVTKGICKELLYHQTLLCVIPKGHPLEEVDEISIMELQNYPLVGHSNPRGFNDWISSIKRINRCKLVEEANLNFTAWREEGGRLPLPFLMNNFGISTVWNVVKDLKIIPVTGKYTERDIYIWYRESEKVKFESIIEQIKANTADVIRQDKAVCPKACIE